MIQKLTKEQFIILSCRHEEVKKARKEAVRFTEHREEQDYYGVREIRKNRLYKQGRILA